MQRLVSPALVVIVAVSLALVLGGCGGGSGFSTGLSDSTVTNTSLTVAASSDSSHTTTSAAVTATATTAAASSSKTAVIIGYKQAPGKADDAHLSRLQAKVKQKFTLVPAVATDLSSSQIDEMRKDPNVDYVEPDTVVHASADAVYWDMSVIRAPKVWPTNTGAGVRVAIIDSGIDYHHPDLAPNYAGGYNYIAKNNDPLDDNGHGTHVAGTIAAAANGSGIEGAAPAVKLYALKVLNRNGDGTYSNVISALQWCAMNNMQIASMSLGASANSYALRQACTAAYKAGVLLVAAAGNSGSVGGVDTTVEYPAAFSEVIAVGAVDSKLVRPSWSSTGAKVELAAPGVEITSDKLGGGYVKMSGTSMACPHVTGVAALVYASGLTKPALVRQRLDATARDLGVSGRDNLYGYGLVNAAAAVASTTVASR